MPQNPIVEITLLLLVVCPEAPLAVTVSRFCLFWWPFQCWGGPVRGFVECSSAGVYPVFFSWLDWAMGYCILSGCVVSSRLIPTDPEPLAEVVSARLSTVGPLRGDRVLPCLYWSLGKEAWCPRRSGGGKWGHIHEPCPGYVSQDQSGEVLGARFIWNVFFFPMLL